MAAFDQTTDGETPLLEDAAVYGVVDYKGRPTFKFSAGGWRSARFIIGVGVVEKLAYGAILFNLITYMTGPMRLSVAAAAATVNVWSATSNLLTLLGAFVADSYLGRYRAINVASAIYVLGFGLLTLSVMLNPTTSTNNNSSSSPPQLQVILFYLSLYLIALGHGCHKPSIQAFGADQFDRKYVDEAKGKSSFFNWWYFGVCLGSLLTTTVVVYIQENLGWGIGFGIPFIAIAFAWLLFLLGTNTYRFSIKQDETSPFIRIGRVFVTAIRNSRVSFSPEAMEATDGEEGQNGDQTLLNSQTNEQFKFLDKAYAPQNCSNQGSFGCSKKEIEEAKTVLKIIPIWITTCTYTIVFSQPFTLYIKQGTTMDRSLFAKITIPAASLTSFLTTTAILFLPIYDLVLLRVARAFTGRPSGITILQRIGTGMVVCTVSIVIAALVELKRLRTAKEYGLVDLPGITIPMSVMWLIPQYLLFGISHVFTLVGMQEFFYEEVPKDLKSMGLALYVSIIGVGNILSSLLVSMIDKLTSAHGHPSWFANNLNKAHLDYFYLLLGGLNVFGFIAFLCFSKSYTYSRESSI